MNKMMWIFWAMTHSQWPLSNGLHLVRNDPDGCSRIYRRMQILAKSERTSPQVRVAITSAPYIWYVGISPHAVEKMNATMADLLLLNEGNIKHGYFQAVGQFFSTLGLISRSDIKLASIYADRLLKIRIDSEAIDDQKAGCYMWAWFCYCIVQYVKWDTEEFRTYFSKLYTIPQIFPNIVGKYPSGVMDRDCKRMMATLAIQDGDWASVESLL